MFTSSAASNVKCEVWSPLPARILIWATILSEYLARNRETRKCISSHTYLCCEKLTTQPVQSKKFQSKGRRKNWCNLYSNFVWYKKKMVSSEWAVAINIRRAVVWLRAEFTRIRIRPSRKSGYGSDPTDSKSDPDRVHKIRIWPY